MYIQFSVFWKILKQFEKPDPNAEENQLFELLFFSAMQDKTLDPSTISNMVHNHLRIHGHIREYYAENGIDSLAADIQEHVFPKLTYAYGFAKILYWTIQEDLILKTLLEPVGAGIYPPQEEAALARYIAAVLFAIIQRPYCPDGEPGFSKLLASNSRAYLLSRNVPAPISTFRGRSNELKKLHSLLEKNHAVFVWGIPGIGKSELVYQYCKEHEGDYTNILYVNFSGNLQEDICTLHIANGFQTTGDMLKDILDCLRRLRENTLLVFDNVNDVQGQEYLWNRIRECGCKLLVTTQGQIPVTMRKKHLELKEISPTRELVRLVRELCHQKNLKKAILEKIILRLHRHTTAVILLAALLQTGRYTPEEILEKLGPMSLKDFISEKLRIGSSRQSFYEHLRTLFGLFRFEGTERYALQNMVLMPPDGVPSHLFGTWTELDPDILNSLIDVGLIYIPTPRKTDDRPEMVLLKPIIRKLAYDEFAPSIQSCATLIHNTAVVMDMLPDSKEANYLMQLSQEVIALAQKDDMPVYIDYLHKSFELAARNQKKPYMQAIADELELMLMVTTNGTNRDNALLLDYWAELEDSVENAVLCREQAIALLNPENPEEQQLQTVILERIAGDYLLNNDWVNARHFSDLSWSRFEDLGMLGHPEILPALNRRAAILCHTGAEAEGKALFEQEQKFLSLAERQITLNRVNLHSALWNVATDNTMFEKQQNLTEKSFYALHEQMKTDT